MATLTMTRAEQDREIVMQELQGLSVALTPSDLQTLLKNAIDLERQHGKHSGSLKKQIHLNGHSKRASPSPMLEMAEVDSVAPSDIEPVKTYPGQHEVAEILKDYKVAPELWDNLDLKVTDAKVAKGDGASLTVSGRFTGLKGYLDMVAELDVSTSGATLTLSGDWKPIRDIDLDKVSLGLKKGVVYTGEVEGTLADTLKADVKIIYPEDPKTKSLGLDFYATNVNIAAVVKHIWSSAPTFLLDFISPIAFSDVAIGYHADKYTILAHPDVSHSPLLAKVLEVIHIGQKDIMLSEGTDGLKLAVSKTITLNLKNPFQGPAILAFALNLDQETKSFLFNASFQATLQLFGDPLAFEAEAGISVGGVGGSGLEIAGQLLAPWHPKGFTFLTIDKFAIKAIITPEAVPTLVELHAKFDLLGAAAEAVVHYNAADASMAMLIDVEHVSLQQVLSELGVKANLGPFNLVLTKVAESFADSDVTVDGKTIPKGYYIEGVCDLFGNLLDIDVKLLLQTSGAEFEVKLDATKLHPLVVQTSAFVSAELRAASDKIQDARDKADKKLKAAMDAVSAAETKLQTAQIAFDSAQAKVNAEVASAKIALQKAQAAFDTALKHAADTLASAQAQVAAAQRAYDAAQASAMRGLNDARQKLSSAQSAFNDRKRDLDNRVNSAQQKVDGIQHTIDHLSGWKKAFELPGLEVALLGAKGALAAAKALLDAILRGAEYAAVEAATTALTVAQHIEDAVAKGVEWAALQAAVAFLATAKVAVEAVLKGSLAVTLSAAKLALEAAQKAADDFLKGVIATALAAARAAFAVAQAELKLDREAADATLSLVQDALKELNDISNAVLNEKLFVLDLFDFGFILTKAEVGIHLTGDMTILGKHVDLPHVDLDMKNPLDVLKATVMPLIMNEIKVVKTELKHFL